MSEVAVLEFLAQDSLELVTALRCDGQIGFCKAHDRHMVLVHGINDRIKFTVGLVWQAHDILEPDSLEIGCGFSGEIAPMVIAFELAVLDGCLMVVLFCFYFCWGGSGLVRC